MKSTPTLARIVALHEEQRALWGRTCRLSEAEQGRLLDIAHEQCSASAIPGALRTLEAKGLIERVTTARQPDRRPRPIRHA